MPVAAVAYGHAWEYNYERRLYEGKKQPVMPSPEPKSGVNWDEDVGGMNEDENYAKYVIKQTKSRNPFS